MDVINLVENPGGDITLTVLSGGKGDPGVAGPGVPTGGTTGQILSKTSNTNYDTQWVTPGVTGVASVNTRTGAITLVASDITSGVIATARLGTGTANTTTFLRGDGTWAAVASGAAALDDLTDVIITSAASANIIRYNGSNWVNAALTKSDVGLANVDNTADTAKPVSTAAQTALNLKAPLASPTFTGTVAGITKTMVGLGNVDNTSDINKPVSTAMQLSLDDLEASFSGFVQAGDPLNSFSGTLTNAQLAPHSLLVNIYNTGTSTWPNRPTSRSDITVAWLGPTAPTVGGVGMLDGVDVLWLTGA